MTGLLHGTAKKTIPLVTSLVLFTALIFGTDLVSPDEVPDTVAYAAMVLVSSWLPWRYAPLVLATVCNGLALVSLIVSPPAGALEVIMVNRGLRVFVLWAIALLAFQRTRAETEVRRLNATLEQQIHERTAQLEAAVRDLEGFTYSVAHDLRSPLRALHGYATVLLDEHAPDLDAEAQHALGRIAHNAVHLGHLIDDLLTFARLNRQPLTKQRVAPANLVRLAWDDLRPVHEPRQVDFVIGDLPPCEADPTMLRQVFVRLLDNALKFTQEREVACITVGCQAIRGEQVYFVRDNGVGFEMEYAHKLFGIFQRLHRVEDYEGTGMGLALAQRIIERHGGRIWATAQVDKGATFYLTL
jgi:signal transduction histidine kinase